MTLVALVAIIALAAGGLIVVMLAVAHVERIGDARPPGVERFSRRPQRNIDRGGAVSAPSDAQSRGEAPKAATARAQKLARAWHGITQAQTPWRQRDADDLLYPRARRRGRELYNRRAGWLAAAVAFSVVLGYLIAHI